MSTYEYVGLTSPGQLGIAKATIPEPSEGEVLIKVEYSVLGPFDINNLDRQFHVPQYPYVLGIATAGTVAKIGAGITDLGVGDRVISTCFPPGSKGFQPYTLQPRTVIAKIPDGLSFEKAVTYPDNLVTAFFTLFNQLSLPEPGDWPSKKPPINNSPILVYGAGATSGQFILQLLKFAGYTNVVAAASKQHEEYLKSLGASHVVDYRSTSFAGDVVEAAGGKVAVVVDCISLPKTFALIKEVVAPGGKVAYLAPFKAESGSMIMVGGEGELLTEAPSSVTSGFPEGVSFFSVKTFLYQQDERLAKTLMPDIVPKLIDIGVQPNRVRLLDHADPLTRVRDAFELLRQNKVSGEKLVVKIGV